MVANDSMNCDAIVVMGKRHAPGRGPRELQARAALAVLYWRRKLADVPIICVEGYDLPNSSLSGAEVVKQVALQAGVPAGQILARNLTNCTAREVEALRDALNELGRTKPLVISHPYHLKRARCYLQDVGITAQMVGCSSSVARTLIDVQSTPEVLSLVERGEPNWLELARETVVEMALLLLHRLDPRGKVERYLSDQIRGGAWV